MNRKNWTLAGAALGMLVLILDSRAAAQAAAAGVEVCIRSVIPSLFPFFLLSGYLTGSLTEGKWAKYLTRTFHAPPAGATVIAAGLLGGYPLGAKLSAECHRTGLLSKVQADRLLGFCSQAGPSFLFGIVAAQFPEKRDTWLLWGIQILSALSVARLLPGADTQLQAIAEPPKQRKTDPMGAALRAMASVCGWVIVFRVILEFLDRWILWIFPNWAQVLICGLMELTSGCLALGQIENTELRMMLAAVMLNFGGICVWMQTMTVAQGLDLRCYLRGKLLQTLLAVLYAACICGYAAALPALFCIFGGRFLFHNRKKGSISQPIGV